MSGSGLTQVMYKFGSFAVKASFYDNVCRVVDVSLIQLWIPQWMAEKFEKFCFLEASTDLTSRGNGGIGGDITNIIFP